MSEDQVPAAEQGPAEATVVEVPVAEAQGVPAVAPISEPAAEVPAAPAPEPAPETAAEQPTQTTADATVAVEQPAPEMPVAEQPAPEMPVAEQPAPEVPTEVAQDVEAPTTDDDLAAAIAEAEDRLESEPGEAAEGAANATGEETAPAQFVMPEYDPAASTVSWWPFVIYDLVWLGYAGYMVWQFQQLPEGTALFDAELYPLMVLVGIVLTIAGPLLILTAWIASFGKPGARKGLLFVSALIKGAVAMAIGVTLWWGAILVLDQLRLGAMI